MNFDQARLNMVEQQIRTWDVLDSTVLDVIGELAREDFVAPRHRRLAYADLALPLDHGEVMMRPLLEGRLLQSLALTEGDTVLEIGTGSGYLTACLAKLATSVVSVDIHEDFVDAARRRLSSAGVEPVELAVGDALGEWSPEGTFDAVAVTASVAEIPERFREWVKVGGRLFVVRGKSPVMEAVLLTRLDENNWATESLFETDLPRLVGAEDQELFVL